MTLHPTTEAAGAPTMASSSSPKTEDVTVGGPRAPAPLPGTPGRKQLPPVPDAETQRALTQKAAERSKTPPSPKNNSYGQFFLEYSLLAEYTQLQKQKLPGVYVMPSAKSALVWHGILFIRQGLYQGGVFRFAVYIPDNYPDGDCPRLVFESPIFHPVIDPVSGELDVKRAFQKWRRNVNHIWQVLLYARRVFYKIDTKGPLNPEAAVLYEQDLDGYKLKVSEVITSCKEHLYDEPKLDDQHAIRFSPWQSEVHEDAFDQILQQSKEKSHNDDIEDRGKNAQKSGLSWMKKGSLQIFTRDDSATA